MFLTVKSSSASYCHFLADEDSDGFGGIVASFLELVFDSLKILSWMS
jgi:hypothetical protein